MKLLVGAILVLSFAHQLSAFAQSARQPNVVVILADDLGYGDLGCYNPQSKIPTPRLDELARQGLRLTDAHSPSAVCTPTRYSLLTGRYPWRSGLKRGVLGPYSPPLIEADRLTLPAMLKQQGYATAIVGKWHLGWDWPTMDGKAAAVNAESLDNVDYTRPVANGPLTRGFDYYFGTDVPNYPPYVFIENDRTQGVPAEVAPMINGAINRKGPMVKGWEPVKILPALTENAVRYIESRAGKKQPFFFYFALTSPHYPVVPSPEFNGKSQAGVYGDFVAQTDAAVGAVLDALKHNGLDKNTLVIFTSDNGAPQSGLAGPFTGVKGTVREGGVRVSCLMRWPGRIPAGSTCNHIAGTIDVLPTVANLIGADLPPVTIDGSDISTMLLNENAPAVRDTHLYYSGTVAKAIRRGDWKLILPEGTATNPTLYDLTAALPERVDLAAANPGVVDALTAELAIRDAEIRANARPAGKVPN